MLVTDIKEQLSEATGAVQDTGLQPVKLPGQPLNDGATWSKVIVADPDRVPLQWMSATERRV